MLVNTLSCRHEKGVASSVVGEGLRSQAEPHKLAYLNLVSDCVIKVDQSRDRTVSYDDLILASYDDVRDIERGINQGRTVDDIRKNELILLIQVIDCNVVQCFSIVDVDICGKQVSLAAQV